MAGSRTRISFGTSGWRGIISDDFTFDNVRLVSQAIALHLREKFKDAEHIAVASGYDPRFLSENFAAASAEVLAGNGIKVYLSVSDVPTPVLSYYIIDKKLQGGINITASHNPPQYSGIKFSPDWGGPALPDDTKDIEKKCGRLQAGGEIKTMAYEKAVAAGLIEEVDMSEGYIARIKELIDIPAIERNLPVIFDPMHGAAREYMGRILKNGDLVMINGSRDVLFGGHRPEPAQEYLGAMADILKKKGSGIGLATDGDADRFGIMDHKGIYITPNQIMGLALDHLYSKGYRGVAARSVMTSSFMDAVAESLNVEVIETPVGFKYIGDISVKHDMIVGGEESGGLTIGGHIPEKDGILACLLLAEMSAVRNKPLSEILEDLYGKVGHFETLRKNYTLTDDHMDELRVGLKAHMPSELGGYKIEDINRIDGYKIIIDKNTWAGLRFSGTEPVVRLYLEASSRDKVEELLKSSEEAFGLTDNLKVS